MILQKANRLEADEVAVNGNLFTSNPKAQKIIADAKAGDTIFFDCIRAKNKAGKNFVLPPLTYKIH